MYFKFNLILTVFSGTIIAEKAFFSYLNGDSFQDKLTHLNLYSSFEFANIIILIK